MLKRLTIDNFAIIDHVELDLQKGFTVITGETGSGKSILLNALNLVTGERADYGIIGPNKEKAVVEAEVDVSGFGLRGFFELNEIDFAEQTIIRREIYREGRSRAFINDTPVQLTLMRDLGARILHIHSQYNTLELKDKNYQLELLDILSGTVIKRDLFAQKFLELGNWKSELKDILTRKENAEKEREFVQFQLMELDAIDLEKIDFKELEERYRMYESGDELRSIFGELIQIAQGDEGFLIQLNEIKSKLSRKREIGSSIESVLQRIDLLLLEMRELGRDAEKELEKINIDPEEMAEIEERMDQYNRLLFKHKCGDQTELKRLRDELRNSITDLDTADDRIKELEILIDKRKMELEALGKELHEQRSTAARKVEEALALELIELKLPDCKLTFELGLKEDPDRTGISDLIIMFSANQGVPSVPIQKAASGGELSRVMLALQYLISQKTQLQTILFDEIDTGVSGDVASRIGQTLLKMAERMQVLAITHLPQVAGKGQHHMKVSKKVGDSGRIQTSVSTLNKEERIDEIARLMSGETISEGARSNAKSLLS
jgi:DNA repair protein RecN (Recombination protein N)